MKCKVTSIKIILNLNVYSKVGQFLGLILSEKLKNDKYSKMKIKDKIRLKVHHFFHSDQY